MKASDYDRLFNRFRHENDGEALARLFDLLAPDLLRLARSLTGRSGAAEDLVQSTFLVAIQKRRGYRAEGRFFGWLAGILATEMRRERTREGRRPDPQRLLSGLAPAADRAAEDEEATTALRDALSAMPEPYRGVLELKMKQDLLPEEIAGRLGRKPGTVRAQLHRGLGLMRRLLPAGLASFLFGVLPGNSALGAVRTAVRRSAQEALMGPGVALKGAGMATGVGVAAAGKGKALVLAGVAILALAPLAYVWQQSDDEGLDLQESASQDPEVTSQARREEIDPADKPAVTGREPGPETAKDEAPSADATPGLPVIEDPVASISALVDGGQATVKSVQIAPVPEGLTGSDLGALPLSALKSDLGFEDATERLTHDARRGLILPHTSWTEIVALVGVEESPFLAPKVLSGRWLSARVYSTASVWVRDPVIKVKQIETKKAPRVRQAHLLLWTQEGMREVPMSREGTTFRAEGLIPVTVDLKLDLADGSTRLIAWSFRSRSKVVQRERDFRAAVTVRDARSNAGIPRVRVSAFARNFARKGEALAVAPGLSGLPEFPLSMKERRSVMLYLRAPGYHARVVSFRPKGRAESGVFALEYALEPRRGQRGRLLDTTGNAVADAFLTVRSVETAQAFLTARSDAQGKISWQARGSGGQGAPATSLTRFASKAATVEVREKGEVLSAVAGLTGDDLLNGADVRLPAPPTRLRIEVVDGDGTILPDVKAHVNLPGGTEEVPFRFLQRDAQTSSDGRLDAGLVRANEVQIEITRENSFPLNRTVTLPAQGGEHLETIRWPETVVISGQVEGLTPEIQRGLSLRLLQPGANPRDHRLAYAKTNPDDGGAFRFEVPADGVFDLRASSSPLGRTPVALRVLTPVIHDVKAGQEGIVVKVCCARRVPIEVRGDDDELVKRADIRWTDDPDTTLEPWTAMQSGFGGYWSTQTTRLALPEGSPTITVSSPGYRTITRSVTVAEDSAPLVFRLERGPVVKAIAPEGVRSLFFRPVSLEGANWPESWIKAAGNRHAYATSVVIPKDRVFTTPPLSSGRWEIVSGRDVLQTIHVARDLDLGALDATR